MKYISEFNIYWPFDLMVVLGIAYIVLATYIITRFSVEFFQELRKAA